MKFLKRMLGEFDSFLLIATTAVMIAPFVLAVAGPVANAG
jgi:hypothetical protein